MHWKECVSSGCLPFTRHPGVGVCEPGVREISGTHHQLHDPAGRSTRRGAHQILILDTQMSGNLLSRRKGDLLLMHKSFQVKQVTECQHLFCPCLHADSLAAGEREKKKIFFSSARLLNISPCFFLFPFSCFLQNLQIRL